ncbi:MAG TPA: hypothetical protein VGE04_17645 [Chloroflexia bacterium]|jgi:acetylornithine deacetylase/succinyl-diaminopimelate desuccinylase-like protein
MIRRTRLTQPPSRYLEDVLSTLRNRMEPAGATEGDESLDILLKHALNTHTPETPVPSTSHVWSKLSRRVRGPFGKIAVEGPAASGQGLSTLGSGAVPFSVGDERSAMPGNSQETSDQHTAIFHIAKEAIQLT